MPHFLEPRRLDPSEIVFDPWDTEMPEQMSDRDRREFGRLLVAHCCIDFGAAPVVSSRRGDDDLRLDLGVTFPGLVVQSVRGPMPTGSYVFEGDDDGLPDRGRDRRRRSADHPLRALVLLDQALVVFTASHATIEFPSTAVGLIALAERESFFAALHERGLVSDAELERASFDPDRAAIPAMA